MPFTLSFLLSIMILTAAASCFPVSRGLNQALIEGRSVTIGLGRLDTIPCRRLRTSGVYTAVVIGRHRPGSLFVGG